MGARALTLTRMDMDEALVSRQIHLLYQPIFSLETKALVRLEALVRWDHPRFGTMLPAVFLPAFEAQDRLIALTKRIVERGLEEFAASEVAENASLSINLSARDLTDPALPDMVQSVLERTGFSPKRLVLECPVKLEDREAVAPVLAGLKAIGVKLAAELMGHAEDVNAIFELARFDEIKTGGRGILRAVRNNHVSSLEASTDLVTLAEEHRAVITAIGAENEAACQALRTVGFHQVQANVLSPAAAIADVTPELLSTAEQVLDIPADEAADLPLESADDRDSFRFERRRAQSEALKRAAEKKGTEDESPIPRGAKAMQSALAQSYGEEGDDVETPAVGPDAKEQQDALANAESKAGLLIRNDLAASSLGYGASPLRPAPSSSEGEEEEGSEGAAIIMVSASEAPAPKSKEPKVAEAISNVLQDLPPVLEDRQIDWLDEDTDAQKADALDAEVAKLPELDETAELFNASDLDQHHGDLTGLAARLRPAPEPTNFLTRKYKLKVAPHFWPKPWREAFLNLRYAIEARIEEKNLEREYRERGEENTVPVMTVSPEYIRELNISANEGTTAVDEAAAALDDTDQAGIDKVG